MACKSKCIFDIISEIYIPDYPRIQILNHIACNGHDMCGIEIRIKSRAKTGGILGGCGLIF